MKRYQCIKNHYIGPDRVFTAGNLYEEYEVVTIGALDKPWFYIVDNHGDRHVLTRELRDHFQELLDLHVDDIPRDEADREPFTTPETRRKLTVGWAWFIVLVITIAFFILKAFTE